MLRSVMTFFVTGRRFTITMKTDDGATQELTGAIYCGNDRITIDEKYRQTVIDALCNFEKVSFFVMNNQFQTTLICFVCLHRISVKYISKRRAKNKMLSSDFTKMKKQTRRFRRVCLCMTLFCMI